MHYRLGVEDIEPGHWIAWALDLPGCFSPGATRMEAVANAGASIAGYEHWLAKHEGRDAVDELYVDIHVAESFESVQTEPDYLANAFFEDDRRPLTKEDVTRVLALLEFTRADLLAVLEPISSDKRAAPIEGEANESINGTLKHVGSTEWWYLDRLDLGFPREELPDDPMKHLAKARERFKSTLKKLVGDNRIVTKSGEMWSARKVARRVLWHEKDHTQQIIRLAKVNPHIP